MRTPRVAVLVYPRRQEGFREAGWIDGQNIAVELHYAESTDDLPRAAAVLAGSKPDVIVTTATPTVVAVKRATQTIPVVMAAAADPVGGGRRRLTVVDIGRDPGAWGPAFGGGGAWRCQRTDRDRKRGDLHQPEDDR